MESDKKIQEQLPASKKYKNIQIIGNGTFGSVYLAKNTQENNKLVAVKHVHQNKKFKNRQLQILNVIKNKNIVALYDNYYQDINQGKNTYLNLIMQYMPYTLSSVIKDHLYCKTFIRNQLILKYTYGLLNALKYLESKNIAHRDIKPSNILLNDQGDAKLCDFGSAKLLVQNQKNIAYICSRYYRSPQLILGAINYGTTIDIWSLGCCVAQMMINRPLFDGSNNNTLLIKIIRTIGQPSLQDMEAMKVQKKVIQKIEPLGIRSRILKINGAAPLQIIQLVEKMLVYDPKKRIRASEALTLPIFRHLVQQKQQLHFQQ